jgi:hypothetical protein
VFINTSPPAERVELLKPLSEIEKMSDESEEIQRPDCLKNITLGTDHYFFGGGG